MRRPNLTGVFACALLCAAIVSACSTARAGFNDLESQVRQFTLPNGLTFLVLERHDAPVFAARVYVNAGGADEVAGTTGIAHMFEHMAFKGTRSVGTTDAAAEAKALDAVDQAWAALAAEKFKDQPDTARVTQLTAAFQAAQAEAGKYVLTDEFSKILEDNGAPDLNAFTGVDRTQYICSLPSNRLELWARMEGDRLTNPVLREFYKERSVVQEERRFQESSPTGRLFLNFWMSSFLCHPYGYGIIGFPSDLQQITREDALDFFKKHYVAKNITIAVVGDVKEADVRALAEKYFSGVSDGPPPLRVRTVEPKHNSEIRVIQEDQAQPFVALGYLEPSEYSPDWPACELLSEILGSGRSSRLYSRLVKKDKIAAEVDGETGFPGTKYDNLMLFTAVVAQGSTTDQVESAIEEEIDRVAREGPSKAELDKARSQTKTGFIRSLRSNQGLAGQLAEFQGMEGDWHKLFRYLDNLEKVQAADVQKLAQRIFSKENRVVGVLRKPL